MLFSSALRDTDYEFSRTVQGLGCQSARPPSFSFEFSKHGNPKQQAPCRFHTGNSDVFGDVKLKGLKVSTRRLKLEPKSPAVSPVLKPALSPTRPPNPEAMVDPKPSIPDPKP